jgi:DNA-binding LacI/PurR family transcriptional regulator
VMECASNDPDAGARGTQALLTVTSPPTAIIAFSDQLALGALRAAQENDTHVPDQLSVIGFDDSPLARHANPPLTTVAQPLRERGVAAGRIVRRLLNGEHPSSPVPYPVVLVERASTAPPW